MGRASVAHGVPDVSSGFVDGFVPGSVAISATRSGGDSGHLDGAGAALPRTTWSAANDDAACKEVDKSQLWFELSLEQRAQFGNCFCRMLLKCLSDCVSQQEVDA